ncbi:dihydrofolate reductase-like domain-containing protein [Coniochaeta sp. 2T2.1]|nr:dihydrofolate reductase-like domain-containing protein [Coniochaeta sp. 2T2.1]
MPPPIELTLVLAATRDMGIGLNGSLPWTGLKKEMAYFARITKRLPPHLQPPALNAVIMGRKTWDSIPPRFRPLKGRLNVVISRSFTSSSPPASPSNADVEPVKAGSLEQAVEFLRGKSEKGEVGRVFVIGGAQIYGEALRMGADRVLLTRVEGEFQCDTHFGLRLSEGRGENTEGWVKRGKGELDAWTGETVPEGKQVEGGTEYEFQMWEKQD